MHTPSIITLQRRPGEKVLISPTFKNEKQALEFLRELLNDISFFLRFYPINDGWSYYNDDFLLTIEPEEECLDLFFETYDYAGQELLGICFEAAIDFIECNKPGD